MIYFLKRILFFVPSLLLISIVVFFLTKMSPGSPLSDQFSSEELDYKQEQENIKALRKAYKLDLPLFYCSLYRASSSDTLYKIADLNVKKSLTSLAYEIGYWEPINNFYAAVKTELFRTKSPSERRILVKLLNFETIKQLTDFTFEYNHIFSELDNITSSITLISNIKKSNFRNYFFKVNWNGFNNQYHHWIANFIKGDFGHSYVDRQSVSNKITKALKWTVSLSLISILLAYLIAVPTAIYSAANEGSFLDRLFSTVFFGLYAIPSFWLGSLCIIFLTSETYLPLFPTYGVGEVPTTASTFEIIYIRISHLFLPVFIWTYGAFAFIYRQLRASLLNQMQTDYYLAASAKGLSKRSLLLKHALRNSLLPMITLFGSLFPALISGSFVVEYLFSIPGMGKLTIDSFLSRDYPIIYGILLLAAALTLFGNLVADILYQWADPRLNISEKSNN